jgi:hypothetical protein
LIKKIFYLLFSLLVAGTLFFSCEKDNFITTGNVKLAFSHDSLVADSVYTTTGPTTTIMFDTIFTTIGSTTKSFRVINPYSQSILISSIKLAGGDKSPYRLNIDGEIGNSANDVSIPANDSIYIFVELTVDPNGVNQPMVVKDSVLFMTNDQLQIVHLRAWGQDFVPVKGEIKTTTWTAEKPYLIYDSLEIGSNQVLSIEAGTHIYLHEYAFIKGKGAISAIGTPDKPIIFKTDRLETLYDDVPAKWYGIILFPNETQSVFENVEIKNATIGLQVGTIEFPGHTRVKLHNVKIEHVSYAGIFAIAAEIEATNTLIANCGYYCVALLIGGNYEFTHCTLANNWGGYSTSRRTSSLIMSNQLLVEYKDSTVIYIGDLKKANFNNSVVYGSLNSEIEFGNNGQNAFNFCFDHCLLKIADSIDVSNTSQFISLTKNIDPRFVSNNTYNFAPDSLSPLRDIGAPIYGEKIPFDLNNVSRLSDAAPDAGAYEYIYIPKKEK